MKVRVKPLRASETEGVLTLSQALSPGCFHFQKRSERALRMDHWNADLGEKNMTHVQGIRIFNPCISLLSPREGKRCFSLWRKWQQTPPPLGHWWKGSSVGTRKGQGTTLCSWEKGRNVRGAHNYTRGGVKDLGRTQSWDQGTWSLRLRHTKKMPPSQFPTPLSK